VWGQKQEKTSTWYGMFWPTGEKLPQVDAISRAWTGQWPSNRCPRVDPIQCEFVNASIAPGVLVKAKLPAIVRDGQGGAAAENICFQVKSPVFR